MSELHFGSPTHRIVWFLGAAEAFPTLFDVDNLSAQLPSLLNREPDTISTAMQQCLLEQLWRRAKSCQDCGLAENRLPVGPVLDDGSRDSRIIDTDYSRFVIPIGATESSIMIVGEGPGQYEQRTGVPFASDATLMGGSCATMCGSYEGCFSQNQRGPDQPCRPTKLPTHYDEDASVDPTKFLPILRATAAPLNIYTAGQMLDRLLSKAGLHREAWNDMRKLRGKPTKPGSVYVTNVIKCRSAVEDDRSIDGLKDLTPPLSSVEACSPFLAAQLYIVRPKVIIALGAAAARHVLNAEEVPITKIRGGIFPSRFTIPCIPDVHPAFVMRQEEEKREEWLEGLAATLQLAIKVAAGEAVGDEQETYEDEASMASTQPLNLADIEGYDPHLDITVDLAEQAKWATELIERLKL